MPTASSSAPSTIEVEDLHKAYEDVKALDGVSFAVASGEVFGLLGHNGAGKTTAIRILSGQARPSSGRAQIAGHDVVAERGQILPLINLVFEVPNLYERQSGYENLRLFADLYGAPHSRIDELLGLVGLAEIAGRSVKHYSTGMKQRLLVARALMNRPSVLFLDEPTRGLDPAPRAICADSSSA